MINPQRLKLPICRRSFHCPKDVQVIEVQLYLEGVRGGVLKFNLYIILWANSAENKLMIFFNFFFFHKIGFDSSCKLSLLGDSFFVKCQNLFYGS